jgi:hypothetical protein
MPVNISLVSMRVQKCSIHDPLRWTHANLRDVNAQKSSVNGSLGIMNAQKSSINGSLDIMNVQKISMNGSPRAVNA